MPPEPAYLSLLRTGELEARVERALQHLEACDLCPWECGVNRLKSSQGAICQTGRRALVAGFYPHFGQDATLTGPRGSGTVFFSGCQMRCKFCQNADISQHARGREMTATELAAAFMHLQKQGCANINLISPTHVIPQILEALLIAAQQGLHIPLVYDTSAYDKPSILQELLDGVVDIYLPDLKFATEATARAYTGVKDYPAVGQAAILEMYRQVGDLKLDEHGLAYRGLLVAHLVMPDGLADTADVMRFIAERISPNTTLSILRYQPRYRAKDIPILNHYTSQEEYEKAVGLALKAGLLKAEVFLPGSRPSTG
jgi:putative pyruvate formate lyase activating enzyme